MITRVFRYASISIVLAVVGATAMSVASAPEASFVQEGHAGFVVTDFAFALAAGAADEIGACPNGMSQTIRDLLASNPEARQADGEGEREYRRRIGPLVQGLINAPNGQNLCMHPEAGAPDPNHHVVTGANVETEGGIDLDGRQASSSGPAAAGTCAHDDFHGANGERGVDNQFYRAVGCLNSFQPTGASNLFAIEMLTGSWGVLITLDGVDDIRNDNDVQVGIFANSDPIALSPTRAPLTNATYQRDPDSRFSARTRGRIENGVLTTDPVDVRMRYVVNSMRLERFLSGARMRVEIGDDGSLRGFLAGYSPVDEIYDTQFAFRNGRDGTGELAPEGLRAGSATGYALTTGHSCNGVYYALRQLADGDRDPNSGACTSISTQYRISAAPAFVVEQEDSAVGEADG